MGLITPAVMPVLPVLIAMPITRIHLHGLLLEVTARMLPTSRHNIGPWIAVKPVMVMIIGAVLVVCPVMTAIHKPADLKHVIPAMEVELDRFQIY